MLQQVDRVVSRAREMWEGRFEVRVSRAAGEVLVVCSRHECSLPKKNVVECLRWDSRDSPDDEAYHYRKAVSGATGDEVTSYTEDEAEGEWVKL